MKSLHTAVAAGAALFLAACSDTGTGTATLDHVAPVQMAAANGIAGQYIVVLKEGANPASVAAVAGVSPRHVYTSALNGFSASLNQGQVNALRHNPAVEYIEQDQEMRAAATQSNATWGLDRIDQRNLPLNGTYVYNTTASTVYAYVLDTGIYTAHTNFGGRASNVYDAFGGNGQDCNGHGTHVAGTIGSNTWGVAKGVRLRGLRVLDCNGSGSTSGIIAAVDWVRLNRINPAVANMSLGGSFSSALNTAVNNLANSGVFVAAAAGNSNADACNHSPASASAATTVAASGSNDARRSSSNWGSCVHLYAPGTSITSTWHTGTSATSTISGTSMAAPHVAGVAAMYKATHGNAASSTIRTWLINNATTGVITGNVSGTPNRLLFKGSL